MLLPPKNGVYPRAGETKTKIERTRPGIRAHGAPLVPVPWASEGLVNLQLATSTSGKMHR